MNADTHNLRPIVTLPTYNEADNIRSIVAAILNADPRFHVLVMDDDSPDGTADLAEAISREDDRVSVRRRVEKRGRGYAGAEGLRLCVEAGYDPIIEMDADFSHDPAFLPRFLDEAARHDVVIGSRHIEDGGEEGRGLARRLITWGAGLYLKTMLGVWRVKDPTSGYRCFRRRALAAIQPETLRSPGPSIVTEILFRCRKMDIKEIPIRFKDRERGQSKFNLKAVTDSLWLALKLRLGALAGRDPAPKPEEGERMDGARRA